MKALNEFITRPSQFFPGRKKIDIVRKSPDVNLTSTFFFIFVIYILGFFSHALYLKKTVYGDGIFYYSWLRSVVLDRDIDFQNEYAHFSVSTPRAPSGLPANKYSVGPALLWSPVFLLTNALTRSDGYGVAYQLAVGFSSVLYTVIGLLLLYLLLIKFFKPNVSVLVIAAIAFTTNLFFYGSLDTVNSHSLSFWGATLFLTVLLKKKRSWFLIGASLGLLGMIRTQDLLYGILAVPFLHRKAIKFFIVGLFLAFLPQFVAWQLLYGTFWVSPYLTSGESFTFLRPHVLEVLFSVNNGLFLYSPILLLGTAGLLSWKNTLPRWILLTVSFEIFVVSVWSVWWQGASYGGRMLVSTLPLFAFGLGRLFQWLTRYGWDRRHFLLIFIVPLSAINMLLIVYFLLVHP